MNKKLTFEVEKAEIIFEQKDSQFATAKIQAFSTGRSLHDTTCDIDVLKKTSSTIYEKPIIFEYDNRIRDFGGHSDNPIISGFVMSNSAEFKELPDGRTSMTVLAKIWKKYSSKFLEVFHETGKKNKSVSVEMEVNKYEKTNDGLMNLLDFTYTAICVLGDFTTPASPGANFQMLSFAKEENEEYQKVYDEEYNKLNFTSLLKDDVKQAIDALNEIDKKLSFELYGSYNNDKEKIENENDKILTEDVNLFGDNYLGMETEEIKMADKTNKDEVVDVVKEEEKEEKFSESENKDISEDKKSEKSTYAEDEKKDEKKDDDKEEETSEDEKEDVQMSLNENLDVRALLAFLESETKTYREMVDKEKNIFYSMLESCAVEVAKGSNANIRSITNSMISYMKEASDKIGQLSKENKDFVLQNEKLQEFKKDTETEKFNFAVESVLDEAFSVGMPEQDIEKCRVLSNEFSLENIDSYVNMVKAKAFVYAGSKEKEKDDFVRIQLPFSTNKPKSEKLWE